MDGWMDGTKNYECESLGGWVIILSKTVKNKRLKNVNLNPPFCLSSKT